MRRGQRKPRKLVIPATQLWMKRRYCPTLLAFLEFDPRKGRSTREPVYGFQYMVFLGSVEHVVTPFGDQLEDRNPIGVVFVDSETGLDDKMAIFPEEKQYLIPYMFRAVHYYGYYLITDVPEHWRKLEALGLIDTKFKVRCERVEG